MAGISAQTVVIDIVTQVIDKTSEGINKAKASIDKLGSSLKKTQQQADKLGKTKSELSIKDRATQAIQKINKSLKNITKKAWNITLKALDKATAPIRRIFNLIKNPLVLTVSILGLSVGIKDTINTFASFESTMSKVKAISGATAEDMKILNAKAKEMGATTRFTAAQAGEAFTYMAMAGWKTNEMLGAIEGVMNLAAASGEELGTVSDILTDAMTAFGLSASGTVQIELADGSMKEVANATHFADVLAAAASNSNTNVALLGESFKYCAPLAGQFKFSVEDTALALGLMANSGIKASNSGTAMRKMLTQLSSDFEVLQSNGSKVTVKTINDDGSMRNLKDILDDTRDAFKGMSQAEREALQNDLSDTANSLGIALSKENGVLKTQAELYDEVMQAAQTMTDAGRVAEAEALAGKTAMAGLLAVVGASDEDYSKLADAVYNADGTAAKMAAIMMDNLEGDFILLQSAAEGVQIAFTEKLNPHLRSFVKWITAKMPDVSKTMEKVAEKIGDAISNVQKKIQAFTSGDAWKNADFFGKISIAWDELILQPFSNWWSGTGKTWFAQKAGEIGNGIGEGLTFGLLAILGFNPQEAVEDGVSIGASFAEGFAEGFDAKKVGEAMLEGIKNIFKDAGTILPGGEEASSTSGLSAALVSFAGYKAAKTGYGIFKGASSLFGGKGKGGIDSMVSEAFAISTMSVSAGVVNVYGSILNNVGKVAETVTGAGTTAAGHIAGSATAKAITSGAGRTALAGGSQALLTGATAAGSGEIIGTVLSNGNFVAGTGGAIIQGLATVGTSLGSSATTIGGAAVAGGFSIGGLLAGGAGIISGLFDIFKGTQSEGKEAKDKYVQGATKIGMVGTGAGIGFAVGGPVGALIGAGIGGIGALWQGSALGKWISDATEEGGTLYNLFQDMKDWASDTWNTVKLGASIAGDWISEKWSGIKGAFSQTWSGFSNWFSDTVWIPIKDIGISVINVAVGVWESEKERVCKIWNTVSNWFTDSVWDPIKDKVKEIGEKVVKKWKSIKEGIQDIWNTVSNWFTDSVWDPIQTKAGEVGDWISTKWQSVKDFISFAWEGVSGWFLETVWMPIQIAVEETGEFVSAKWQEAKNLVSATWKGVSTWFTDTLWEPLQAAVDETKIKIKNAFEEAKTTLQNTWNGVAGWFEEYVWGPIGRKASEIWTDIKGMWENVSDWVSDMGDKGSEVTGLKTSEGGSTVIHDNPPTASTSFIDRKAQGGILTKPHIALVAEAGPEAIIPLSGTNKYRGIELWRETGKRLGMFNDEGVYAHARGGIFGVVSKNSTVNSPIYQQVSSNKESEDQENSSYISAPVTIGSINLGGINFTFNGTENNDKESIMRIIREQMPEIANEVAEEMAKVLQKKFANMKSSIA